MEDILNILPNYCRPGDLTYDLWLQSLIFNHSAIAPYYLLVSIPPYLYCDATSSVPKKMIDRNKKNSFFKFFSHDRFRTNSYDT